MNRWRVSFRYFDYLAIFLVRRGFGSIVIAKWTSLQFSFTGWFFGLWLLTFSWRRTETILRETRGRDDWGICITYTCILCSLRIRIRTPWSENERDRNVEASGPGKCLGANTVKTSDRMVFLFLTTMLERHDGLAMSVVVVGLTQKGEIFKARTLLSRTEWITIYILLLPLRPSHQTRKMHHLWYGVIRVREIDIGMSQGIWNIYPYYQYLWVDAMTKRWFP